MDTPDYDLAFKQWKAAPGPEANASMLNTLDPVIDGAINTHVGRSNPLIKSRARSMTLDALNKYNPDRGRLTSHVYNHLQGLKRYTAQSAAGIHVPERVSLDRRAVDLASTELRDTLGREPTDDELADHTGFSGRRLQHIKSFSPVANEGFFSGMGEEGGGYSPAVRSPASAAWEEVVKGDLDPIDQKIFEYTKDGKLSNQQIAMKLKLSPGRVSQRKLVIQQLLDKEQELSPF